MALPVQLLAEQEFVYQQAQRHALPVYGAITHAQQICLLPRPSTYRSLSIKAAQLTVSGDRDLGKQLFFGKGRCSGCHMIRGQGGLLGPDLSNVGGDRTLAEIRQSIVSPGLSEGARYRGATVITAQGEKIAGTLRNRDNFSLQMMDTQGNLHFFSSAELREVTFQEKSAMPENYGKLLNEVELQDLLAFLSRQTVAE